MNPVSRDTFWNEQIYILNLHSLELLSEKNKIHTTK